MERIALLIILLKSLLISKSAGQFERGYNESFFDIILEDVSYKNSGKEFSVEFKSIRTLWNGRIKSLWFVDEVPILMDDSDWFVEDTSTTSTLKKYSGKSGIQELAIKVNLYSSNGMITVDFGKGDRRNKIKYSVSSEEDRLLLLERSTIPLADGLEYTTYTDLQGKGLSFDKSLQWEVMDVPFFDRTNGKAFSFKRNIPIRSDSASKWTYYGTRDKKSVYGKIHFTATVKGAYNEPSVALNYIRNVKIYTPPRYSSNSNDFPIFFLHDQTFFKDISSKSYRLYQCYILEDNLNPGDAWMYLMTNSSSQIIDLQYFSYKYIRYGYQTELYSIVKDPTYFLDDATCITSKDRSGYEINKKD